MSNFLVLHSPRPEKRVREASPPPAASPIPARPPSPASTSGAAAQQVDMLAKPKAKASGAARAIVPLKVLRPKILPIKKSTSKAVDLGLGGVSRQLYLSQPPGLKLQKLCLELLQVGLQHPQRWLSRLNQQSRRKWRSLLQIPPHQGKTKL